MEYADLSPTAKRRFRMWGICPICEQFVSESDNIQYIKYRSGKSVNYTFFHTSCLKKAREDVRRV